MNYKYLILLAFIFLFGVALTPRPTKFSRPSCHGRSTEESLTRSYVRGERTCLPKEVKEAHQKLGLIHLMTPSGLHYSALYLLLTPLLWWLKKRKQIFFLITMIVWAHIQGLQNFYSLKRMATMHLLRELLPQLQPRTLLMWTLLIEGLSGNFQSSPMSFALSVLFLIIIFECPTWLDRLYYFFLAQIGIALIFHQGIYPMGTIFGFILTPLFSLLFSPLALLHFLRFNSWANTLSGSFLSLVEHCSRLSSHLGIFHSSILTLPILFIFILRRPKLFWFTILIC